MYIFIGYFLIIIGLINVIYIGIMDNPFKLFNKEVEKKKNNYNISIEVIAGSLAVLIGIWIIFSN